MSARLIKAYIAGKRRGRAFRKQPLLVLKRRALAVSRSSMESAEASSFAFVPVGAEIKVLSWPQL